MEDPVLIMDFEHPQKRAKNELPCLDNELPKHLMLPPPDQDSSFEIGELTNTPRKRKRKLIVDEVNIISREELKAQVADTKDLLTTLDLAPPTKKLMHCKEIGGIEVLFALSGKLLASNHAKYSMSCTKCTKSINNRTAGAG